MRYLIDRKLEENSLISRELRLLDRDIRDLQAQWHLANDESRTWITEELQTLQKKKSILQKNLWQELSLEDDQTQVGTSYRFQNARINRCFNPHW